MPRRLTPLVEGQIYHVFNRGIDHRITFNDKFELKRAFSAIEYYRFTNIPLKFSKFIKLPTSERNDIHKRIRANPKLVDILSFCLMPNHFHILLRQAHDNGVSKFLANFQNSYTKYFNTKNERDGPLFLRQFKSVLVDSDEQLVHLSRYIHLNPITSYVVKDFESLLKYPWSSLPEYFGKNKLISEIDTILGFFKDKDEYLSFLKDQVSYQRELDKIKHILLDPTTSGVDL